MAGLIQLKGKFQKSRQSQLELSMQALRERKLYQKIEQNQGIIDFKDAQLILRKETLNQTDIKALRLHFKDHEFFQQLDNYPEEVISQLFNSFKYEQLPVGSFIMNYDLGETGTRFYIIIKGSALVLLPNRGVIMGSLSIFNKQGLVKQFKQQLQYKQTHQKNILDGTNFETEINQLIINKKNDEMSPKRTFERQILGIVKGYTAKQNNQATQQQSNFSNVTLPNGYKGLSPAARAPYPGKSPKGWKIMQSLVFAPQRQKQKNEDLYNNALFQQYIKKYKVIEEQIHQKLPQFEIKTELQAGQSFGEIALLLNTKRTATVLANTQIHLLSLGWRVYEKLMGEQENQKLFSKINFLKQFQIFSNWSEQKTALMVPDLTFKSFQPNEAIFKCGDPANQVYFVQQGEVELSQAIQIEEDNETKQLRTVTKLHGNPFQKIKVYLVQPNNYFGEDEILEQETVRNSIAIVKSAAVIGILSKELLLRSLLHKDSYEIFLRQYKIKKQ